MKGFKHSKKSRFHVKDIRLGILPSSRGHYLQETDLKFENFLHNNSSGASEGRLRYMPLKFEDRCSQRRNEFATESGGESILSKNHHYLSTCNNIIGYL